MLIRSNRIDTNSRLCSRPIKINPPAGVPSSQVMNEAFSLRYAEISQFDPAKTDEYKKQRESLVEQDSESFRDARTAIKSTIVQDPNLTDKQKQSELTTNLKKHDNQTKLFKRHQLAFIPFCSRCGGEKEIETTSHLFLDCPHSKPFLQQMITSISQPIKAIEPNFTWQSLWQNADGPIGSYPGDLITAYWLILGLAPAKLDTTIKRLKAQINIPLLIITSITKTKQLILNSKREADLFRYYATRTLLAQHQQHPPAQALNTAGIAHLQQQQLGEEELFPELVGQLPAADAPVDPLPHTS